MMVGRAEAPSMSELMAELTAELTIAPQGSGGRRRRNQPRRVPAAEGAAGASAGNQGRLGWAEVGQTVTTQRATSRETDSGALRAR